MKKLLIVITGSVLAFVAEAQRVGLIDSAKINKTLLHYQPEYTFDTPVNEEAWSKLSNVLYTSFVSTNEAYFRTEVPAIDRESHAWEANGWRGERLNGMLLCWAKDTINQIRIFKTPLRSTDGKEISAKNIKFDLVRFVLSNYPYDAREVSCGEGFTDKAWLLPDRLESFDRFELPGKTVRPVWFSVDVPADASPGVYYGNIEVRSEGQTSVMKLKVTVQQHVLPKPYDWKFRLDLWQNPWVLARYYQVDPWSTEHKALLKKHLKFYADAGGKFITTYAVHSPWADVTYRVDEAMIDWIKMANGKWKFNYDIFDQYVQLCMEAGIDKAITIYTPIPWGERFRYLDEKTGNYITERWLPTSDTFRTNWNAFLTDLKSHLEKKGWFNKTFLGINENAMEQTLSAIRIVKSHSKDWKITYAGDWHPELDKLLDDYSCVFNKEPGVDDVKKRKAAGQTSTYYICCTPPKPNTFVFSPPVEGRWLGWYTVAHGYDGMLRWAYDSWPGDPVRDARHVFWGAGDCFMVYPGANSSIRFEKMREGIADFEKLRILREKAARSTNADVKRLMKQLEEHLQTFNNEKEFKQDKLRADLTKGMKLVDELSEKLK
jgi:hypothetical protein